MKRIVTYSRCTARADYDRRGWRWPAAACAFNHRKAGKRRQLTCQIGPNMTPEEHKPAAMQPMRSGASLVRRVREE